MKSYRQYIHYFKYVFYALWITFFFSIIYLLYPFLHSIYSITHIPERYYSVHYEKSTKKVSYKQVSDKPKNWKNLKEISKRAQAAIVSSEDGKFYYHAGYDVEELRDAVYEGLVKKRQLRGASTITQQLVKNLFLNSQKNFSRKAKELSLTLWLEKNVSKEKILETYLNVIEYGEGIYGIENASQYYFKKSSAKLNAREAAFLAMLLPSPKRYAQSFKRKKLTPFAQRSIRSILFKMLQGGHIGIDEYYSALDTPFSWEIKDNLDEFTL